jgi:predicted RNA-binding Zn-ribbon protein involved in translation (DUF1610 family)
MEINLTMRKNRKLKEIIFQNKQVNQSNRQQVKYICPHCQQQITTIQNDNFEVIIFACPKCGQKGIIRPFQKKQIKTNITVSNHSIRNATLINTREHNNIPVIEVKILGLILIMVGIALQFVLNIFSLKISLVLVIIGAIVFMFIPDNRMIFFKFHRTTNNVTSKNQLNTHNYLSINYYYQYLKEQFDISEKIAIVLILWIISIYLLTGVNDIDIFIIFVYLGILSIKIISDHLVSYQLKQRITVFTVAFLFIFIVVVIKRILNMKII